MENVHVHVDSKDAFAKKSTVFLRHVQTMDIALTEHASVKKVGPDKIVHKKTKMQFLAFQPAITMESLILTPKNVFVIKNSAEMTVQWSFVI